MQRKIIIFNYFYGLKISIYQLLLTASVVDVVVLFKLEIAHGVLLSSIRVLYQRSIVIKEAIIKTIKNYTMKSKKSIKHEDCEIRSFWPFYFKYMILP